MTWFSIFLGGGLGSVSRFGISKLIPYTGGFPWATIIANLTACMILGYMLGNIKSTEWSDNQRLMIMTGFCGGLSTFSTFSAETYTLIQDGSMLMAGGYVLMSIISCLIGIFLGYQITKYV